MVERYVPTIGSADWNIKEMDSEQRARLKNRLVLTLVTSEEEYQTVIGYLPLSMGYHTYSWAWWTVFSFLHTPFSFNVDNGLTKALLLFVVYFIVQVLIEL